MKESTIFGLLLLLGGVGLAAYGIARRSDTSEIGMSMKSTSVKTNVAPMIIGCSSCDKAWSRIMNR